MKRYFSLENREEETDIYIYGDITSWDWYETDISSYTLAKTIEGIAAKVINVFINSYGGEVAEGLAIYNNLRRHTAQVKTYCDGFACSAASVVFMAGDERIMSNASLLMVHNAWTWAAGNADELRKTADDIETITAASVNAYMNHVAISKEELKKLLDEEAWLDAATALDMGFATAIVQDPKTEKAAQSVRNKVKEQILGHKPAPPREQTPLMPPEEQILPKLVEEPKEEPKRFLEFLKNIGGI